jgi:alkanesulfonate monooxygenase SsuD/methylene tetrahydromethanopterin reductase-like flavin-dependent oxidoreductase (luciferase family)
VSKGRVDFGTGESSSRAELEGFGIDPGKKRGMWREATEQIANMLAMDPYPGFTGEHFSMPCRNVVPKPVQKPHPPMWLACSTRETIHVAAKLGLGALTFAFVDPTEAKHWVEDYYRTLETECVPIGHAINPNIAMVTGFSCHRDAEEARRRGLDGFRFFGYALAHFYIFGTHKPGRTDVWKNYEAVRDAMPEIGATAGIGTPDYLRQHIQKFSDVGVDQVIFIQQGGNNRHDHICESLELFAREVMPAFKEGADERQRAKMERLAPVLEKAMARKKWMPPIADQDIPEMRAYGRTIVDTGRPQGSGAGLTIPTEDPARGGQQ